jgi:CRP-like cAMP-binding protein
VVRAIGRFLICLTNAGTLTVVVDTKIRGVIKAGAGFGELALMASCGKRQATIMYSYFKANYFRTKTPDCVILYIDKLDWNRIMKHDHKLSRILKKKLLTKIPAIDELSEIEQDSICDCMVLKNETQGTVLIKEGDPINDFFILVKGKISVWKRLESKGIQVRLGTMQCPDYYGDSKVHKQGTIDLSTTELRCDTDCQIALLNAGDAYLKLPKKLEAVPYNGLIQGDVKIVYEEGLARKAWKRTKRDILDSLVRERFQRPELTQKEFRRGGIGKVSGYRDLK